MILEIKFLGIRLVFDHKTVEALLGFITVMVGSPDRNERSASTHKTLD